MTRPLPNLTTLRVNAEIPKPVALYRPAAGVKVEAEGKAMAAKRSFVVKGAGPSPDVQDTAERAHQVAKWVKILVNLQKFGAIKHIKDVHKFAEETLEVKATLKVATRAFSFEQYLRWAKANQTDPYPLDSEAILEFLRCQAATAPTRATRFLEAAAFAGALFGLEVDHIFTPQARGIVAKGLKRKRETKRMEPFAVRAVTDFELFFVKFRFPEEGAAAHKEQVAKAVFVGCLLWTVHGAHRGRACFGCVRGQWVR